MNKNDFLKIILDWLDDDCAVTNYKYQDDDLKNYENNWENYEDSANSAKSANGAELPRDETREYLNIKRFNDEIDQKLKELEDELVRKHGSETWLRNLWLRWLILWKSGCIWLMTLRVSPKWWGGNAYFENTPSFYALSEYFNNFTSINKVRRKHPAALLLTYYTFRVTLLEKTPSGNTRNLYLTQTILFRRALKIFGVRDEVIKIAGALGRAISKKIWKR